MSVSVPSAQPPRAAHDRGYHPLTVKRIDVETDDASSFVLDIPDELAGTYQYKAGQFLTFRVPIDGRAVFRSYSMSSAPGVDSELAVTVKRVPGGAVSNWMNDTLRPGDTIEASAPAGVFRLGSIDRDILAFAAGSGITPILSILKTALVDTPRRAYLLYANRDRESTIFAAALEALSTRHSGRLEMTHHLDCDSGFVDRDGIAPYVALAKEADCYVCGPAPFMDLVESALLAGAVPAEQIHIERFTVSDPVEAEAPVNAAPAAETSDGIQVTLELNGQTKTTTHHPGTTILQTARQTGLIPPYSCEAGNCATCMAKLLDGEVTMHVNNALFEDEVADGWILTCQSVPTTPTVHVVYGYEGT